MQSPDLTPDALWATALENADVPPSEVALVPVTSFENPESQGRFMPAGDRDVDLAPQDLAAVSSEAARARVVLPVERLARDPAVLLALMRHHLEYARVLIHEPETYRLSLMVAAALSPVYSDTGRGSAVIYNAIPMMRSANAAAGRAVTSLLGPQFDRVVDPVYGPLFRSDRAPLPLGDHARNVVVFAAVWPDAFENELFEQGRQVDEALSATHAQASHWWSALQEDETFSALALGAASFRPTPAERRAFEAEPARAWRLAEALIERARNYGLEITGGRAPARGPVEHPPRPTPTVG